MAASWHVSSSTRDAAFWKRFLNKRITSWLWELDTILDGSLGLDKPNFKCLFVWLEKLTRPEFGMSGPFMGLANRRRIWDACQVIAPVYRARTKSEERGEATDEEATAILNSADSLHMPLTLYPQPHNARTISAQFIRSWNEISGRSCDLNTYWNENGALVGIAVTFGGSERVFGTTEGSMGEPLHIDDRDWISEIRTYIYNIDMFDETQDRSAYSSALQLKTTQEAHIHGLTVGYITLYRTTKSAFSLQQARCI